MTKNRKASTPETGVDTRRLKHTNIDDKSNKPIDSFDVPESFPGDDREATGTLVLKWCYAKYSGERKCVSCHEKRQCVASSRQEW